jgi:hypothetical protein
LKALRGLSEGEVGWDLRRARVRYAFLRRKKCAKTLATRFKSRGVAEPATRMRVVIKMPPRWKFAISIRSRMAFIR